MNDNVYDNPLVTRYSSSLMNENFSNYKRTVLWRKLWIALAESEKELGLNITDEQIKELKNTLLKIDFNIVNEREKKVRHDVMAHIYAYGLECPAAAPIIHLGATSCYVTDNSDIIIYDDALKIIEIKIVNVIKNLKDFALNIKVCLH